MRAAAETFRPNPKLRVETVITEMPVGEALISMLEAGGTPAMVDRARICPPRSRIGAVTPEERAAVVVPARSPGSMMSRSIANRHTRS